MPPFALKIYDWVGAVCDNISPHIPTQSPLQSLHCIGAKGHVPGSLSPSPVSDSPDPSPASLSQSPSADFSDSRSPSAASAQGPL